MKNQDINSEEAKLQITLEQIEVLPINPIKDKPVCRICLDEDSKKQLIQPCLCGGSIAYVHEFCLISYISKKLQKQIPTSAPKKMLKYRCQLCRIQIYLKYILKYKINCHPWAEGKRFTTWLILLILLILFSLVETLMLIMIIVYYTGFTGSFLFSQGKIWIIITITPLLALGVLVITFYFICENLYGGIMIQKVLGKKQKYVGYEEEQSLASCISLLGYVLLEPEETL